MAMGGAWVEELLGSNIIRLTGRTFGAAGDAELITRDGDGGDHELTDEWYANDQADLDCFNNVIVLVNTLVNSQTAGPIAGGILRVSKAIDPFSIQLTWDGNTPTGDVEVELYIIWPHSAIQ